MTVMTADVDVEARGVRCVGCSGIVPEVTGPTHPYMQASPGCWQVYGNLCARTYTDPGPAALHWHQVDCYAVQHPGGAQHDRRQRQSVAIHLTSLCLLQEHGQPPAQTARRRGRLSQLVLPRLGRTDWPYLAPPAQLGPVTVVDVHATSSHEQYAAGLQQWTSTAWAAWSAHHDIVRSWATIVAGSPT